MGFQSFFLTTLAASCVSTSQALTTPTAQWGVYHLPTFDDDIAAALLPNASELSLTFMRQGELWIMPQYWSANDSWYEDPTPEPTLSSNWSWSSCAYSNKNHLPQAQRSAWIVLSNLNSCAAGALHSLPPCASVVATWQPLVAALPENLTLLKSNVAYIEDTDTVFVFGARAVVDNATVFTSPYTTPIVYSMQNCTDFVHAVPPALLVPVTWTFLYDVSAASWIALSPEQTGPGTPSLVNQSCIYAYGLKSMYNPSLRTVYAIGAFDFCADWSKGMPQGTYAFLYAFNMTTLQWTTIPTHWGPPGAPVPACSVQEMLTLGTFAWADDGTSLIVYGGVPFMMSYSAGSCYAIDVRSGTGIYLKSCSYGFSASPFTNFDSAYAAIPSTYTGLGSDVPLIVLMGGRHSSNGGWPSSTLYMDQYVWVLWSSHASASPEFVWTQATVDVSHTTNSWAALGAAPATLTAAKLFPVVSPTVAQAANTFTFVAWGGLMVNASSEPLLEYNWWEGAHCYQMFDGFDTFQPLFSRTNVMHVLTLTLPSITSVSDTQLTFAASVVWCSVVMLAIGAVILASARYCINKRHGSISACFRLLRYVIALIGLWCDLLIITILIDVSTQCGVLYQAVAVAWIAVIIICNTATAVVTSTLPARITIAVIAHLLYDCLVWPYAQTLSSVKVRMEYAVRDRTPAQQSDVTSTVPSITSGIHVGAISTTCHDQDWLCLACRIMRYTSSLLAILTLMLATATEALQTSLVIFNTSVPSAFSMLIITACTHVVSLMADSRSASRRCARDRAAALRHTSAVSRARIMINSTAADALLTGEHVSESVLEQGAADATNHSAIRSAVLVTALVSQTERKNSTVTDGVKSTSTHAFATLRRVSAWSTVD